MENEKREFKVGDIVLVKNWMGTTKYVINRVTKTQAISDVLNEDGTKRYSLKFRKTYYVWGEENGITRIGVTPVPIIEWNTNEYFLVEE